jgi:hypothetical protein
VYPILARSLSSSSSLVVAMSHYASSLEAYGILLSVKDIRSLILRCRSSNEMKIAEESFDPYESHKTR